MKKDDLKTIDQILLLNQKNALTIIIRWKNGNV
jgi:hypothetical protein